MPKYLNSIRNNTLNFYLIAVMEPSTMSKQNQDLISNLAPVSSEPSANLPIKPIDICYYCREEC
jgi:hypothetical protein